MYLLIENPGVASVEAFTLLGASNKSGTDAIGQFGSGTKFGTLALLRAGLDPIIYCGNQKLAFGTKPVTFDGHEHQQVFVKLSGKANRTEDLSVVLRYGEIDWKSPALACREFVSNALDAVNGDHTQVTVELVTHTPRAKAGVTRIYIPYYKDGVVCDDIKDFARDLSQWFLHWSDKAWKTHSVLPKDAASPARIYRRGVFVREVPQNSLCDYNLNQLPLDEARIASDWTVAYYAADAVRNNPRSEVFARILALGADDKVWEQSFELAYEYDTTKSKEKQATAWKEAAEAVVAAGVVLAHQSGDTTLAEGKGYAIKRLSENVFKAARQFGLRTPEKILTADEREGRRVDAETDPQALAVVTKVWADLGAYDLLRSEAFPVVKSYAEEIQGGARTLGLWKDGVVYINKALLSDTVSRELYAVALEEIAHHVTKATDNSRDFQEYFIQAVTRLLFC